MAWDKSKRFVRKSERQPVQTQQPAQTQQPVQTQPVNQEPKYKFQYDTSVPKEKNINEFEERNEKEVKKIARNLSKDKRKGFIEAKKEKFLDDNPLPEYDEGFNSRQYTTDMLRESDKKSHMFDELNDYIAKELNVSQEELKDLMLTLPMWRFEGAKDSNDLLKLYKEALEQKSEEEKIKSKINEDGDDDKKYVSRFNIVDLRYFIPRYLHTLKNDDEKSTSLKSNPLFIGMLEDENGIGNQINKILESHRVYKEIGKEKIYGALQRFINDKKFEHYMPTLDLTNLLRVAVEAYLPHTLKRVYKEIGAEKAQNTDKDNSEQVESPSNVVQEPQKPPLNPNSQMGRLLNNPNEQIDTFISRGNIRGLDYTIDMMNDLIKGGYATKESLLPYYEKIKNAIEVIKSKKESEE